MSISTLKKLSKTRARPASVHLMAGGAAALCLAMSVSTAYGGAVTTVTISAVSTPPNLENAIKAAKAAAAGDPLCAVSKMGDFYWEIGDSQSAQPLASNIEGSGSITATSNVMIASASKLVFGAYVLEKKGIDAVRGNAALLDGLRFMSGYTGFDADQCKGKTTVGACYTAGNIANPTLPDERTLIKFAYDGGHDQKLAAVDLGLANFTARQLDQEYRNTLGLSTGFHMLGLDVLMAGGLQASATDYAQFLRRILNKELVIGSYLGADAVCALPRECPGQVAYSPVSALGEPWKYSYNHWVESEMGKGSIDAYSSPGKFGFYPWIAGNQKYYGIVSREDIQPDSPAVSVKCGRQIRKAFLNAL